MTDTIAFQKRCPVSHATFTNVSTRRELRQLLKQGLAIEVFCTSCAQLHALDADERLRLSRLLIASE
jgi:hypothetical protein